jgi:hypothetical protein
MKYRLNFQTSASELKQERFLRVNKTRNNISQDLWGRMTATKYFERLVFWVFLVFRALLYTHTLTHTHKQLHANNLSS